jgi:phosphoenolpyruvate-protein phosphotransferase
MQSNHLSATNSIRALAISPGLAVGPAQLYKPFTISPDVDKIAASRVEAELVRFHKAQAAAINELRSLSVYVSQTIGSSEADIFVAQQLMLEDPELLEEIQRLISMQHFSATSALLQATESLARELEALDNETLAARSVDLRDATTRVAHHLQETNSKRGISSNDTPIVIIAHDLTPSDTANLDPTTILGICTVAGGPTTHAAIIARTLEIPAIAGIDPQLLDTIQEGQQVGIDGTQGLLYLHLTAEQQRALHVSMRQQQEVCSAYRIQNEARWSKHAASTADGIAVQVFANVGDVESARAAAESGAEGIGLLRTEFLFGGRSIFPNEQEQFMSYTALFRAFADHARLGKTIIARTLDAGADKPFPALEPLLKTRIEANPALGIRGVRIHLMHEELLRQQLRALLRAGAETGIQLHIMFPMIATLEEVRRLRAIYSSTRQELQREGIALPADTQMGIMIETPAAALMADVLAQEVDFFSIGANDLFQYTMAADRTNSRVMGLFGELEPAVLRLIKHVVDAGRAAGKTVALCGELAADICIAPLLIGLGVQELSMSPPAIVRVKAVLHEHTMEHWHQQAREMLQAETADELRIFFAAT